VAEGNIAHELGIADPGFKAADRRSKV
jgi:hypothetical protein